MKMYTAKRIIEIINSMNYADKNDSFIMVEKADIQELIDEVGED